MSVQPQDTWPIPEETRRIACAAFPDGNLYLRLRDEGLRYPRWGERRNAVRLKKC